MSMKPTAILAKEQPAEGPLFVYIKTTVFEHELDILQSRVLSAGGMGKFEMIQRPLYSLLLRSEEYDNILGFVQDKPENILKNYYFIPFGAEGRIYAEKVETGFAVFMVTSRLEENLSAFTRVVSI